MIKFSCSSHSIASLELNSAIRETKEEIGIDIMRRDIIEGYEKILCNVLHLANKNFTLT